jgi:hypothetical protein
MHAGVEQDTVAVNLNEPRAGADVSVGIQIRDVHQIISTQRHEGTKEKDLLVLVAADDRRIHFGKSVPSADKKSLRS